MYDELMKIYDDPNRQDYLCGEVGYYFFVRSLDHIDSLKETLIKDKMIGKDDNVELVKIEDPEEDFEPISSEWRFSDEIKQRFLDVFGSADVYYEVTADGSYAAGGCNWGTSRVLRKGDEFVLLEFYLCD